MKLGLAATLLLFLTGCAITFITQLQCEHYDYQHHLCRKYR